MTVSKHRRKRYKFEQAHVDFVKEHYATNTAAKVVDIFNERFENPITIGQLRKLVDTHKLAKYPQVAYAAIEESYDEERLAFIKHTYQSHSLANTTERYNAHYGEQRTRDQIRYIITKMNYQKSPRPERKDPPGTKRRTYREYPDEWQLLLELSAIPPNSWLPEHEKALARVQSIFGI